ncbi:hypothetical protein, variant [Verruconis gallopava]|uniref:Uncharacterized protein n=1 Tax=Verruconis gallopava TaxID=253628 RepID=A0A0D2B088_9PEZI|nr:hypothetical protein, variant [Verruconis gallopava]KIW04789.1 hypothetical protein, variant [Verruconis gallopava]
MKAKIFGSSKSKPSAADPSSAYHSSLAGQQQQRASSPAYPQQGAQAFAASTSQNTLERSPSLRQSSSAFASQRPPPAFDGGASPQTIAEQRIIENRGSVYFNQAGPPPQGHQQLQPVVQEKEHKRGIRDKLGFGHSSKPSQDVPKQSNNSGGAGALGRSLSVSKKRESLPEKYYNQPDPRSPYRRSANSSQNLLNTHTEEDEETQRNVFGQQQHYSGVPPPPPAKESDYEPRYSQQPAPPSAYYQDPRSIGRVQTDPSLQQTHIGNVELRNPIGQGYQYKDESAQSAQDQYHVYQQAGHPDDEATPGTPYQASSDDVARYSYSQQQPPAYSTQQQHGRVPSGQSNQPELYYPQPSTGRDSEKYRPPSQLGQFAGPQQEPPSYDKSTNSLYLQAPHRGTSIDQPPSPLAPSTTATQPGHESVPPPPSPQPPSTADSAQSSLDSMPNQSTRSGNTMRAEKAAAVAAAAASAGSRESSGSQGAPFRGQQGPVAAAAAAGQQKGRDSPAPEQQQMAPVELADEEASSLLQLQKEHKELREKYQKVKKYYFEKEAQVHSLQNTLAHQRLAASRTSLDDSEYAARFSRLDGLITQLSFSIRKSWKTIPEFLQRTVNKDALTTGKQEMTAVGKAYMSHWLVSNLFDMYFHPSLELGLSKDLKEIWNNVRKYCPPFQSGEEEEALNSKLVNWRMTTIDGLQERLRAPEAATHRSRLVEMLNEKMVGDMSLLLADPAPPDLAGGISMIIDLAVTVAQHIPMESRDVSVEYYYPGTPIATDLMKIENGIPALTTPVAPAETSPSSAGGGDIGDHASVKSTDTRESSAADQTRDSTDGGAASREEKKARGMFGGLMSGGSGGAKIQKQQPTSGTPTSKSVSGMAAAATSGGRETPAKEEKVRLCVGMGVQIRGRIVLAKAPVYGMSA